MICQETNAPSTIEILICKQTIQTQNHLAQTQNQTNTTRNQAINMQKRHKFAKTTQIRNPQPLFTVI